MVENMITLPQGCKLQSNVSVVDIIGNVIIWIFLSIITLGFAMFVYFYYYNRFVINNTFIIDRDGKKIGKLKCDLNLGQAIGHGIIWILITIITFGLGLFFYFYKITSFILNKTEIEMFDT